MVWDPGFENAGTFAGDASGWTITVTDSNWGWAQYGAKDWGVERYETDWNNDNYIFFFTPGDLDAAEFDPDNKEFEPFLYWAGATPLIYFEDWTDITDEAAEFDTTPEDFENFEEDWNNSPFYPAFSSFLFGIGSDSYTISTSQNKLGIKLEHSVNPDFDAVLDITTGVYTPLNLAIELLAKVNAALVAAGGAFGAGDILFGVSPVDNAIVVVNNKSTYIMRLYSVTEDGWPDVLGRSLTWRDYRYFEADLVDESVFAWVGQYNSSNPKVEQFERDWDNSELEYYFAIAHFFDGEEDLSAGITIQVGVNDTFSLRIRNWGTGNVTSSGVLTVPPAAYTATTLAAAMQIPVSAWLLAAGGVWGLTDILVDVVTYDLKERIRIRNNANVGAAPAVVLCTDQATLLWDAIGMPYDDPNHVEEYLHSATARWREDDTQDFAAFDAAPEAFENFETDW